MTLGELGHQLNRSGKGCCNCFSQSYSTPCPLDLKNGWELFPLFPIYPYPPQGHYSLTLDFLLSLLYKASFGHVIPELFFFLIIIILLWILSSHPKGQCTQCSFLRHFIKQFSPQGCMNPQTLTDK